jgi:ATP-dependent DNA helicase RecG
MATEFKLNKRTIERWLKQLREAGKIEFRGAAKTGGYYCLDADQ